MLILRRKKKTMTSKLLISISLFFTLQIGANNSLLNQKEELETKILYAIKNEGYTYLEEALFYGIIDPNHLINGKPIISYACTYNKPEMVRLFYVNGADLNLRCIEGYLPEEHAQINNAINALAEIIVIKA